MVLNLRPGELTLLDCVVEECDERFSQEKQEEILAIIGNVLGTGESDVVYMEGNNGAMEKCWEGVVGEAVGVVQIGDACR